MTHLLEVISIFVFLLLAVMLVAQYLLRFVYNYHITEKYIEMRIVGLIPLYRIPIGSISRIDIITFKDAYLSISFGGIFTTFRCGNRLWGEGVVLIEKETGFIKKLLITPDQPKQFVATISQKSKMPITAGLRR